MTLQYDPHTELYFCDNCYLMYWNRPGDPHTRCMGCKELYEEQ